MISQEELVSILLVEDNPAHAEAVRRALKASGMNVVIQPAGTLKEYRELAAAHQPDIAILDLSLPDGLAVEVLISPPEAGPFPIVVITSQGDELLAVEAMKAGALDYIVKSPEAFAGMPRTVERVLHEWRMLQERKQAEEEQRKSEERFKLIFTYAPDAYYLNDLKGKFIDGNKAAEKTTGYKREELIGGSFLKLNLLSLDQLPKAAILLAKNAIGIATGPDEFILKRKDGEKVRVEISTHPVTIENRTVVLGIARDITERMQTEEARRQAEENFRRSIAESPLGISIVSAEDEMLYANRAILDIYGYKDIEELKSTPVKNRYAPESYAEYQLRKKKRMDGADYPSEYEIGIIRKTGEIRRLRVFRKAISWNGQKQFQAIYQDITEQKKVEEKLKKTLISLRNALDGVVKVLSVTTEKRDPYTAGHQRRVADLAWAIGKEMGLGAERVEGMRIAGTIHDIGKMSIPAEILSKPARLTDIENMLIQSHAQVGHDILHGIDFSWPIAEMVLQHHERMNGSGYPLRLKGEDILLEARILAVSDVVEAMASHRPYRPALGIEAALEEIDENKGVLYDSDVAAACLKLFREKGFIFKA
jgi:PAS domain S-box-containing protein/putative nucleotidyltransferase with HDIG domain